MKIANPEFPKNSGATGVPREVLNECCDYITIDFVSITDSTHENRIKSTGYELYIKCSMCDGLKKMHGTDT